LRRADHEEQRVKIERERWDAEVEAREDEERTRMETKIAISREIGRDAALQLHKEYVEGMKAGTLAPERAEELREFFARNAK
jgi:hypothetical protein